MVCHNGRIFAAGRGPKAVAEPHMQNSGSMFVHVNGNSAPVLDDERAKVVDAVGMVGVGMSEKHRVEPIDVRIEKLLPQIRRGINQDSGHAT